MNIIANATESFAPEDIPSTKGPAMGLRKNVCSKKPETESAPPSIAAVNVLGSRILQIMLLSTLPSSKRMKIILKILAGDMLTLPVFTLSTKARAIRNKSAIYTIWYLIIFDLFIFAPFPGGGSEDYRRRSCLVIYLSFIRLFVLSMLGSLSTVFMSSIIPPIAAVDWVKFGAVM